jgi:hypothetical protein
MDGSISFAYLEAYPKGKIPFTSGPWNWHTWRPCFHCCSTPGTFGSTLTHVRIYKAPSWWGYQIQDRNSGSRVPYYPSNIQLIKSLFGRNEEEHPDNMLTLHGKTFRSLTYKERCQPQSSHRKLHVWYNSSSFSDSSTVVLQDADLGRNCYF